MTAIYHHSPKTILMMIGKIESVTIPKYPNRIEIKRGIERQNLKIRIIFETENKKKKINISFVDIPRSKGINTFVSAPPIGFANNLGLIFSI